MDFLENWIKSKSKGDCIRCRFVLKSSVNCRMMELADRDVMKRQNKI